MKKVGWVLRCRECGTVWLLEVSFDISDMKQLYHYCKYCKRNTFHDILGRLEDLQKQGVKIEMDTDR